MTTSWAQHKTVIERSQFAVGQIFSDRGKPLELEANRPLLLDDPHKVFYVEKGAVDLFLVDRKPEARSAAEPREDGRPGSPRPGTVDRTETGWTGRRWHVVRVTEGNLFPGVEALARGTTASVGLLAVGISGTRLFELELQRLRAMGNALGATESVLGLLDAWVRSIAERVHRGEPPRGSIYLDPGEKTLDKGALATTGSKTLWVQQQSGSCRYAGLVSIPASAEAGGATFLPVTRSLWLEAESESTIKVLDGAAHFAADKEWASLRYFHHIALIALLGARSTEESLELERSRLRQKVEKRAVNESLARLVTIEGGLAHILEPAERDLQLEACRIAGKSVGIEVVAPPKGAESSVETIARASRVRTRRVVLHHGWWNTAGDAMIGFTREGQQPIALVPRRGGGFDLVDPATGTATRADERSVAILAPHATMFYRSFPSRRLTAGDLLSFGLAGNGYDFWMVVLAGLFLAVLGMIAPYAFGEIVDRIVPNAEVATLLQMGLGLAVVAGATFLTQVTRSVAMFRIESRASSGLMSALWDRLLAFPVPFFRRYSAGELADRATGIETIRREISGTTITALLSSIFSLTNFALLLYYDVKLASAAAGLAVVGVAIAIAVGLSSVMMKRRLEQMEGKISSLLFELLTAIVKLRISGAENRAFSNWARRFSERCALSFRFQRRQQVIQVMEASFPAVCSMVIFSIAAGGPADATNKLSTGNFLAFNAAFGLFLGGLLQLANVGVALVALYPVWERAKVLLEQEPEVDDVKVHPGVLEGGIQVTRVSFRYVADGPLILDDVDFTIKPGEFVAVVGASGAGKSSLFRILLGFERPAGGGVYYDGQELASLDATEVRRQLGVVLQDGQLIAGDIFTNIVGSRQLTHEDAWDAARRAGLDSDLEAMPMGLMTVIDHGGKSLSGGQRQRVQIARAIVHKPRIIFFDEATSALDERTQKIVSESLENLQATRVVIAHRLSTVKNADRIIVLDKGRLVQQGRYEDLMAVEGVFRELAKRQVAKEDAA